MNSDMLPNEIAWQPVRLQPSALRKGKRLRDRELWTAQEPQPDGRITLRRWGSDHFKEIRADQIEGYDPPNKNAKFWTLHLKVQLVLTESEVSVL